MNLPSKHSRLAALAIVSAAFAVPATASATVNSNVDGTTLNVTSDDAGDAITIGDNGPLLTVNGVAQAAAPADNTITVKIDAGGGDDTTAFTTTKVAGATINGGAGNDLLNGSSKVDTIHGDDGNDRVVAAVGNDHMFGDNGNDVLVWNPGEGTDTMDGGAGADETEVNGGNNTENFTYGPGAAGHIDFERVSPAPFGLDITTTEKLTINANGGDDTVTGAAGIGGSILTTINGGNGADTVVGGDGADLINGGDDNDALNGGGGDDRIVGDRGNDTMAGAAGDDTLVWNNGDGSDVMDGQDGFDRIEVNGAPAAGDAFTVAPAGGRVNFQRTNLGPFSLNIASSEDLEMNTLGGDDTIAVANGLAGLIGITADGGSGNDVISGGDGADTLLGGSGNDTITGGGFFDVLNGETGDDTLLARDGASDQVIGGPGTDRATTDALNVDTVWDVETLDATPIPNPNPSPAPRPTAAPLLLSNTAKVTKGVAAIKIRATDAAAGTATIVSAKTIRLGKIKAHLVLGSVAYSLKANQTATVKIKLASGTARLATRKSLSTVLEGVGKNAKLTLKF